MALEEEIKPWLIKALKCEKDSDFALGYI